MNAAEKTAAMLQALKDKSRGLIWAQELAFSSGARRADFWTLHPHNSKGYHTCCYEIKASRSDFKGENWHRKHRDARLFSDHFYVVAPVGMAKVEELPDFAGLWEWSEAEGLRCTLEAPRLDKHAPSWEFVVSIMRNSGDIRRDTDLLKEQLKYWEGQAKRLQKDNSTLQKQLWERMAKEKK